MKYGQESQKYINYDKYILYYRSDDDEFSDGC